MDCVRVFHSIGVFHKMIKPAQLKVTWSYYKKVMVTQRNACRNYSDEPMPLRNIKSKSSNDPRYFVDYRRIQVNAGNGGHGCLSYLKLWCNEKAGPDGGNGGNGGHVIFRVPLGTIVKRANGQVVADLSTDGTMFIAARGGAGGRGNHYFASSINQSPQLAEYGGKGETVNYTLELRCMADIGLIGFPNAGKSTLLQAISRARPEVAPYPFTTLRPFIGMIRYSDFEQVSVADLPGLVKDSHKNEGLGIGFLRHAERCAMLAMVLDLSEPEPWKQLDALNYELSQFSSVLAERPQLLIANKIDLPSAQPDEMYFRNFYGPKNIALNKAELQRTKFIEQLRETQDTFTTTHHPDFRQEWNQLSAFAGTIPRNA